MGIFDKHDRACRSCRGFIRYLETGITDRLYKSVATVAGSIFLWHSAAATATCKGIPPAIVISPSVTLPVGAGSYSSVGDMIAIQTIAILPDSYYADCSGTSGSARFVARRPLVNGYSNVYDMGIPGFGVRFSIRNLSERWFFDWLSMPTSWAMPVASYAPSVHLFSWNLHYLRTEIIKTSLVTSSGIAVSGQYGAVVMDDGVEVLKIIIGPGSVVIKSPSCTTQNINVNLGMHKTSAFSGINSFTPATPFNIALNSCPAGINAVKYQIDAVTTIVNAANSVVALDGSSSAKGIGVQLLTNSGAILPLGTPQSFSGYNTAGGNFNIPLKARYYQTAFPVSSGTANTSMVFTMTYQ